MFKVLKPSQFQLSSQCHLLGEAVQKPDVEPQQDCETVAPASKEDIALAADIVAGAEQKREEILEDARVEAEGILQEARQNAERLADEIAEGAKELASKTLEQAEAQAQQRVAEIEEEARQKGIQKGRAEAFAEYSEIFSELIGALEGLIPTLEGKLEIFFAEWEKNLRWLALQVSRKALDKLVSENELMMEDMIISAVDTVRESDWLDVEVSSLCTDLLERLRSALDGVEGVSVSSAMLPKDEARISTSTGVIEVSLAKRLDNIEQYFKREGI